MLPRSEATSDLAAGMPAAETVSAGPTRRQALRDLFRGGGKLLLLASAAPALLDSEVPSTLDPAYKTGDHWWGMLLDIDKCVGSGNCVRACAEENHVPDGFFRTWVERYEVIEGEETPIVESPNGGKDGFGGKEAANGEAKLGPAHKAFFVPKMCNHCADSPCTQVCPVGATFVSPDGVVLIDKQYCIGCRYCVQACPYGCRYFNEETRTVDKCTLCYHRITQGLTTACAEACPTGARQLVDLKNPNDPVHEILRTNVVHVLKPHLATKAKAFYLHMDGAVR